MVASGRTLARMRGALSPQPTPVLLRAGIAVLVDVAVLFAAIRFALLAAGHPTAGLTHAVLPALFGGMFAFMGSLGGNLRSGLARAVAFSAVSLPLTLLAVAVRGIPIAAGLSLAGMAVLAGVLAWYGEPLATLGTLLLYIFFIPLVFGAGRGVPLRFILLGFAVMLVCTVLLRALVALVPKHRAPPRADVTGAPADDAANPTTPSPKRRFVQLPQPQLGRLHRTTLRSAIGLGVGAFVMSATGDHNAVWVLMTLIALIPPATPLTIDKVLQRLAGTAVAMIFLTVVDSVVPPGPARFLVLAAGLVLTVAYLRRSYAISVLGISMVSVIAYAHVDAPLGEALLYRGLDTLIGAFIAIVVTLLIPVGSKPKPVWASESG